VTTSSEFAGGRSQEVAQAICFLLGDAASYMTGARVPVDSGFLI
jgi:NAD(P)-dependent dehydrogenase (short-subunit alcohol dehydrogenase family)